MIEPPYTERYVRWCERLGLYSPRLLDYPLIATLYVSGASGGTVISFVAAKTLWSISRMPLEIALVGLELTLIRVAITFAFPMLAGLLVNWLCSPWSEKIRKDVMQLQKKKQPGGDGS